LSAIVLNPWSTNDINYDPASVNKNRTISVCCFEKWCPGAVIGSLFRHHIHLTGLIYSVISIWSIILAIVNQALKPLRYSLQLENPYTSASTPPRVTVHEPDPRFGFGNRQLATSACFIGSWRFYLTSGWGLLMYPAYTRVCLIYYYPFLVKEER
jgi:hypothetical protein